MSLRLSGRAVTRDRLKALTKLATGLHTKCVKLFGQEFPGVADIAVNEINTHPEELLLEIILNQISLRLGQSAARRLFAKFGPEPSRGQARHRPAIFWLRCMAARGGRLSSSLPEKRRSSIEGPSSGSPERQGSSTDGECHRSPKKG